MINKITDLTLLKIMTNRDTYNKYYTYIRLDILDIEIKTILLAFRDYYDEVTGDIIELDSFATWFFHVKCQEIPDSSREIYKVIFTQIDKTNEEVASKVIEHFQNLETLKQIQEAGAKGFSTEKIRDLLTDHDRILGTLDNDEGWVPNDITRILTSTARDQGLRFRLDCLNKSLNRLIKGDFGIIAAYVDTGKTTLAISEAAFMAQQVKDGKVLWLNNEEFNDRVIKKIWQSVLNCSWEQIELHKDAAIKEYTKRMNGDLERIKFIDIRGFSIDKIKTIFKRNSPKLVVIDQIDKIQTKTQKTAAEHDRLKKLYGEMRSLANEYCPIIAISQADASTRWLDKRTEEVHYQKYIDQSQLDGSKIGKPGEADFIITIGKDPSYPTSRFIHVSKNKMDGVQEQDRHIKAEVIFNGECSRYENP